MRYSLKLAALGFLHKPCAADEVSAFWEGLAHLRPRKWVFVLSRYSLCCFVIGLHLANGSPSLPFPTSPAGAESASLDLSSATAAMEDNFRVRVFAPETAVALKQAEAKVLQGVATVVGMTAVHLLGVQQALW